jgi:23S rRNA pseudouridine955/2504/2580 synthase
MKTSGRSGRGKGPDGPAGRKASSGGQGPSRADSRPARGAGPGRKPKPKPFAGERAPRSEGSGRPVRPGKPSLAKTAPRPSAMSQQQHDEAAAFAREEARKAKAAETLAAALPTAVQTIEVTPDENGMRIDRFMEARFPGLSFSHIQRVVRKGELRVDGKRVETKDRVPPLRIDQPKPSIRQPKADEETRAFLRSITLYEDADMMVLDKPMGLAVQGGSGTTRHVDKMLEVFTDRDGQKPRLVHRLDKDTSGCLVIAKTRFAAAALAKSFRSRDTRKVYWALVAGVPRVKQGRVSTYLAKDEDEKGDQKMRVARHGDEGASHAVTYYAVVETAAQKVAWLSMKPVTGRTHQLRAHAAHIGHPIIGDPKYFDIENWEVPGGLQQKLHLLARRIVVPHPRSGHPVDVTAPLPPHMQQSWNLLGFDTKRYDPIEESPSE